jgi:hypothetical protein
MKNRGEDPAQDWALLSFEGIVLARDAPAMAYMTPCRLNPTILHPFLLPNSAN